MVSHPHSHEWETGLTIRRQAAGSELAHLLTAMETSTIDYQGVEVRRVAAEPQYRSVGINLLNASETRVRNDGLGRVGIEEAKQSLLSKFPSLNKTMEVDVNGIRIQRTFKGPRFLVVDLTKESTQAVQRERKDITRQLDKLRGHTGPYDWLDHILDITVAYIPRNAHPETIRSIKATAENNRPTTITLLQPHFISGRL